MSNPGILGLHHVTAIASDPQCNLDFYTQTLGLRLVKLTVNFDDPTTYHFYFADAKGNPGTILTFFPWPNASPGQAGTGQTTSVSFAVPQASLGYWSERLKQYPLSPEHTASFLGEEMVAFADPDGMRVNLVADALDSDAVWAGSAVPPEHAIRRLHSVTLSEEGSDRTAALMTQTLGFQLTGEKENRFRFAAGGGTYVDMLCQPEANPGRMGAGAIHHVAFRTANDARQEEWKQKLTELGYDVSPMMDRQYFHSIYFREPGGVLFEIATDPPGFATDETPDELGTRLMLPEQYEVYRAGVERAVLPLRLPAQK